MNFSSYEAPSDDENDFNLRPKIVSMSSQSNILENCPTTRAAISRRQRLSRVGKHGEAESPDRSPSHPVSVVMKVKALEDINKNIRKMKSLTIAKDTLSMVEESMEHLNPEFDANIESYDKDHNNRIRDLSPPVSVVANDFANKAHEDKVHFPQNHVHEHADLTPIRQKKIDLIEATFKSRQEYIHSSDRSTLAPPQVCREDIIDMNRGFYSVHSSSMGHHNLFTSTNQTSIVSFPVPRSSSSDEFMSIDARSDVSVITKKSSQLLSFGVTTPTTSPGRKSISPDDNFSPEYANLPDEYSFHDRDWAFQSDHVDTNLISKEVIRPSDDPNKKLGHKPIHEQNSEYLGPLHKVENMNSISNIIDGGGISSFVASKKSSDAVSIASSRKGGADDDSTSQATAIHYGRVQSEGKILQGISSTKPSVGHEDLENSIDDSTVMISLAEKSILITQKVAASIKYQEAHDELREGADELRNMTLRDPSMPMAIGLSAAALVGAFFLGPVGVMVGAAAVGIAAGVMQIPEAQRLHAIKKMNDYMQKGNEIVDSACATVCLENSAFPPPSADILAMREGVVATFTVDEKVGSSTGSHCHLPQAQDGPSTPNAKQHRGDVHFRPPMVQRRNKIVPVHQIHALDPEKQPRAWLDILANSMTSVEEKNEAMEEILIWTKDKNHARMLLEEGILDSLLFMIMPVFEKYSVTARYYPKSAIPLKFYKTDPAIYPATMAATCCIALAKAHCAAANLSGDLVLMPSPNFGNIPVEKQCSLMLLEVRHYIAVSIDNPEPSYLFQVACLEPKVIDGLGRSIAALAQGELFIFCAEIWSRKD